MTPSCSWHGSEAAAAEPTGWAEGEEAVAAGPKPVSVAATWASIAAIGDPRGAGVVGWAMGIGGVGTLIGLGGN